MKQTKVQTKVYKKIDAILKICRVVDVGPGFVHP
jgi:hypothetical protein